MQEFVDLLVPELEDGRMILGDCFILDRQEEVYMRPTVDDDVSRTPTHYQLIPWEHTKTGDFLRNIDPEVTVSIVLYAFMRCPVHTMHMDCCWKSGECNGSCRQHTAKYAMGSCSSGTTEPALHSLLEWLQHLVTRHSLMLWVCSFDLKGTHASY